MTPEERRHCGVLVNGPFTKWQKKTIKVNNHATLAYHLAAKSRALGFMKWVEFSEQRLTVKIDAERAKSIRKNRHITKCRGQGYDGAANMSSNRVGTQACIKRASPLAVYVHCNSHKLNLLSFVRAASNQNGIG